MGFNGARAELRWAEKKKYNHFRNFLIQGNGIEIKSFKYFQTKFELDSKQDKIKSTFWDLFKFEN